MVSNAHSMCLGQRTQLSRASRQSMSASSGPQVRCGVVLNGVQCSHHDDAHGLIGPGFTRKPPKYERFIRPTGALVQ
jgi:hypothetical protein